MKLSDIISIYKDYDNNKYVIAIIPRLLKMTYTRYHYNNNLIIGNHPNMTINSSEQKLLYNRAVCSLEEAYHIMSVLKEKNICKNKGLRTEYYSISYDDLDNITMFNCHEEDLYNNTTCCYRYLQLQDAAILFYPSYKNNDDSKYNANAVFYTISGEELENDYLDIKNKEDISTNTNINESKKEDIKNKE